MRPEWDGLRIDPCLPPQWQRARILRNWRGASYDITIERTATESETTMDGKIQAGTLLPVPAGREHHVVVVKIP